MSERELKNTIDVPLPVLLAAVSRQRDRLVQESAQHEIMVLVLQEQVAGLQRHNAEIQKALDAFLSQAKPVAESAPPAPRAPTTSIVPPSHRAKPPQLAVGAQVQEVEEVEEVEDEAKPIADVAFISG